MAIVMPNAKQQYFDSSGNPLSGGKLYTYSSGTVTLKSTYSNAAGTVSNTNPIVLDSRGEATIYWDGAYDIRLEDSSGNLIYTGSLSTYYAGAITTVVGYGADPTGVSSSVSAFQAAINATTNGTIVVIDVPIGTYAGNLATVSIGTRTVVWREWGNVTYSTSAPPGNRQYSKYSGDVTRPWLVGNWGLANSTTTGTSTDRPVLRIQRDASHTGGTTGGSIESSAASFQSNVGANVQNYETALIVAVDCSATGTGSPNIVAGHFETRKNAAGTTQIFGVNIVAKDTTTSKSSTSLGALIGNETDIVCAGPDDSNLRIGQEIISREYATSADGATSVYCGLRVRTSAGTATTIKNGIIVAPIGAGSITRGMDIQGTSEGIYVQGNVTNAHIEIQNDSTAAGVLKVGSQRLTATNTIAQIVMTGYNASSTKTNYANMFATIGSATAGSENGTWTLQTMRAGTLTTELSASGGLQIGAPTGGAKGVGTANFAGDIYKNNTAYNNPDYVFEKFYTGRIDKFASNEGADKYGDVLPLSELRQYTKDNLRLPGMTDEEMGAFGRADKALEKIEELSLYIMELNERIAALEARV